MGADEGASQQSVDMVDGELSATLPANRDDVTPAYIPHDMDIVFETTYRRGSVYVGRARYVDGEIVLDEPHEIPDYCWYHAFDMCLRDDPVDGPVDTPE